MRATKQRTAVALVAERGLEPAASAPAVHPLRSARARLEMLCDEGSLHTVGSRVRSSRAGSRAAPGDGVLAASGLIDGRPVLCYASDPTCFAGSLGEAQADAVVRILQLARRVRVPVIGVIDSVGARLQEGVTALDGYGRVFREVVATSRVVPQISIVAGVAVGGAAYCSALTDFVVMSEDAQMFLTGPRVLARSVGENATAADLGAARVHGRNGVCHLAAPSLETALALGRRVLGFLPQAVGEPPPPARPARPASTDPRRHVPHASRHTYDMLRVIDALVDDGVVLEVSPRWARNLVTGFARLDGRPVGVIANQPRHLGGLLDVAACRKAVRFIDVCERFGLPLLVLVDTPGFLPGTRQEGAGVITYGADLVRAFAGTSVPRVTLVLRKAYGGAYIAMNSKGLGADMVFAWPCAEIGIMSAHQAVEVVNRREVAAGADREATRRELVEEYAEAHLTAFAASSEGVVDEVIDPDQTRQYLVWAMSLLAGDAVR
jgi:acetyl-CoA carboxylase carboxyltransferase component